jgi:hypothetical protein
MEKYSFDYQWNITNGKFTDGFLGCYISLEKNPFTTEPILIPT